MINKICGKNYNTVKKDIHDNDLIKRYNQLESYKER